MCELLTLLILCLPLICLLLFASFQEIAHNKGVCYMYLKELEKVSVAAAYQRLFTSVI